MNAIYNIKDRKTENTEISLACKMDSFEWELIGWKCKQKHTAQL